MFVCSPDADYRSPCGINSGQFNPSVLDILPGTFQTAKFVINSYIVVGRLQHSLQLFDYVQNQTCHVDVYPSKRIIHNLFTSFRIQMLFQDNHRKFKRVLFRVFLCNVAFSSAISQVRRKPSRAVGDAGCGRGCSFPRSTLARSTSIL